MFLKKTHIKIISVGIVALVVPFLVFAALVPCGPGIGSPGDPGYDRAIDGIPCKLCHIFTLFDNVVKFILQKVVPMVAIAMFVVSGVMFFGAMGNPAKISKATSLITSIVLGLVIIYGAYLIINLFFMAVGVSEWTGLKNWFEYPCYYD